MTHVTCRLTAKNRDQLRNPMRSVIEYGLPIPLASPLRASDLAKARSRLRDAFELSSGCSLLAAFSLAPTSRHFHSPDHPPSASGYRGYRVAWWVVLLCLSSAALRSSLMPCSCTLLRAADVTYDDSTELNYSTSSDVHRVQFSRCNVNSA